MEKEKRAFNWGQIRKYVFNKYVIVLAVFAVIFMVGKQSIFAFISRGREIREIKHQIQKTQEENAVCERDLRTLKNTDSLERYAREHYYMHAENEDVYIVTED
ncbi:MAG: septum formation initiator family protein [Paludibacteraceae bacterium]|nr:septum formation initiator family protein [Paludibacteraceae bacterium]